MNRDHVDLSIVIPAFNEEARIGESLDKIRRYFSQREMSVEVIVVDDGSNDNTLPVSTQRLRGIPHQILRNGTNRGKGYSVRRGINVATGDRILFTDADLSTPIDELDRLMRQLDEGCEIAIGSRAVTSSKIEVHQSLFREIMGKIFNRIARFLTFRKIHDSQCGFKVFKKDAAKKIFACQKIDGFCFDAEVLYLAQKMGYRIAEVGVRWINSPQSRVKIVVDSTRMFFDLFRIRLLHISKKCKDG